LGQPASIHRSRSFIGCRLSTPRLIGKLSFKPLWICKNCGLDWMSADTLGHLVIRPR
jgi:hypothetical protein